MVNSSRTLPAPTASLEVTRSSPSTVMTAVTTALSLLALVLFGGRAIEGFAQVMLYGVVICTYSAICISSPMLIYIGLRGSEATKAVGGKVAPAE